MKKTLLVLLVACALFGLAAGAQERLTLATPAPLPPQIVAYTVSSLHLTWEPAAQVFIVLRATDGTTLDAVYDGAPAAAMILGLNKANLSTRSLNQRIFDRLIADGKIAGTVTGAVP